MRDRDTGRSRGFGFVTYASSDEANAAIAALNEHELDGRRVKVNMANARGGGGGGGGFSGAPAGGYGGGYSGEFFNCVGVFCCAYLGSRWCLPWRPGLWFRSRLWRSLRWARFVCLSYPYNGFGILTLLQAVLLVATLVLNKGIREVDMEGTSNSLEAADMAIKSGM